MKIFSLIVSIIGLGLAVASLVYACVTAHKCKKTLKTLGLSEKELNANEKETH